MASDLADRLYELPPDEFVAARDELARSLRADGDREAADAVAKLRRPTVAAWAVNQVVRRHPDDATELFEAAEELRRVQRRTISGVGRGGFREASDRRRAVVDRLVRAAREVLSEHDRGSDAHLDAVRATFEAASLGEDGADDVRVGRLGKELPPPSGFGAMEGLSIVEGPPRPRREAKASREPAESAATARLRRERERARATFDRRGGEHADARRAAIVAGRAAERAAEEAEELRRRADDAADEAARARQAQERAEREAERARSALEAAAAKLEDIEAKLAERQDA